MEKMTPACSGENQTVQISSNLNNGYIHINLLSQMHLATTLGTTAIEELVVDVAHLRSYGT